jgi:hypothetical protein
LVLLGAPQKPEGVVIRFQLCLTDGTIAMHGEGRVLGFRPQNNREESALMVRFTRLDARSKELLDRAMKLRLERELLLEDDPSDATDISSVPSVETPVTRTLEPPSRPMPLQTRDAGPASRPVSAQVPTPTTGVKSDEKPAPEPAPRSNADPPPSTTPETDRTSALDRLRHRRK